MVLKRWQTIGLVTSCIVTQEEQGQTPVEHSDTMQSVMGKSNDTNTHIGGASVGDTEKAGQKPDSVQSLENRKFNENEEEKQKFIPKVFS